MTEPERPASGIGETGGWYQEEIEGCRVQRQRNKNRTEGNTPEKGNQKDTGQQDHVEGEKVGF